MSHQCLLMRRHELPSNFHRPSHSRQCFNSILVPVGLAPKGADLHACRQSKVSNSSLTKAGDFRPTTRGASVHSLRPRQPPASVHSKTLPVRCGPGRPETARPNALHAVRQAPRTGRTACRRTRDRVRRVDTWLRRMSEGLAPAFDVPAGGCSRARRIRRAIAIEIR